MGEKYEKAICFPKRNENTWVCICGYINKNTETICKCCGNKQTTIFEGYTKEVVFERIRIEKIKKEEEEKRELEEIRRIAQENARKRKKNRILICCMAGAFSVMAIVAFGVYKNKYGMNKEELRQYNIAKENYDYLTSFLVGIALDYNDLGDDHSSLFDNGEFIQYSYNLEEAEKDSEYIHARGLYLSASLMFDMIADQFPEKYQNVYRELARLKKADVVNDIKLEEMLYLHSGPANSAFELQDEIGKEIRRLEGYLEKKILNPDKIKINPGAGMITGDYSDAVGISCGLLFYDDGRIKYSGEFQNGKADGYGEFHYLTSEDEWRSCEGSFSEGYLQENEYCTDAADLECVQGDFVQVMGVPEEEKREARKAIEAYIDANVKSRYSSIGSITYVGEPTRLGNYYYFKYVFTLRYVVTKFEKDIDTIIEVIKNSDNTYTVSEIKYMEEEEK